MPFKKKVKPKGLRAISPIANYSIQLIPAVPKRGLDSTGTVVEYSDTTPVLAQFTRGGLTEWEQIVALEHFDFSGLPDGVNPLTRVSMYDCEAAVAHIANESERESMQLLMEERLVHLNAIFPSEFKIVEKPAIEKPWPTIDQTPYLDGKDSKGRLVPGVLTLREQTGISPEALRLYFVEHPENPDAEKIIAAMEELEAEALGGTPDGAMSVAV